ncbi:LysR family transcriptional regulator [Telmatospirillum siberiense]|uniref:LysR family transcriptional regulator n=1 Tax=Telmatospirillum siberiense TaxID=382514 RepID=A0A2N3PT54_9PROT|nr:LysR family transcriptional regulator [Telmatospirillum siberiense]PKU23585.1 LysR family transcriptional regulator [Telmatospirillum siberiense]
MDLKALETFVWVAHLGGFRTAADRLNATQPAISARIAQLEEELGVRLFDRESRRATLTEKGLNLLGYAERMLALRSEMVQAVAEKGSMRGIIRLGVAESIVHTWLSRLVERLHYLYPAVSLEIEVDTSFVMREELLAHQLDLAFLVGPITEPQLKSVPLCSYELAWVASPSLPLPPEPVPLKDLARWPIITFSRNTRPYGAIQEMFSGGDMPAVRLFGNSSLATVVRMTLDGIGVSAIPPVIISRELTDGRLKVFQAEEPLPRLDFVAAYAKKPDSLMAATIVSLAAEVAATPTAGISL